MASLNMGISYDLTYDEVNRLVVENRKGNYAFGYLDERGVFIVRYVGRSDTNLREEIKNGITNMEADNIRRYDRFKFSYAETDREAYEKECQNYHDFGGAEGFLLNTIHPDKPEGYTGRCPICGD